MNKRLKAITKTYTVVVRKGGMLWYMGAYADMKTAERMTIIAGEWFKSGRITIE
jgi:hypothetical protein